MVVAKVGVAVVAVVKKMVEKAVVAKMAKTAVARVVVASVDARIGARGNGAPAAPGDLPHRPKPLPRKLHRAAPSLASLHPQPPPAGVAGRFLHSAPERALAMHL